MLSLAPTAVSSPIGRRHARCWKRCVSPPVAGSRWHLYVALQTGGAEEYSDDDPRQTCGLCSGRCRGRAGVAGAFGARHATALTPAVSSPRTARSTSSHWRRRAAIPRPWRRAGASSTISRQCLRRLCLQFRQVSNSITGKARSRSATCARPPGKTAPQEVRLQIAELSQRDSDRFRRRPGRARAGKVAVGLTKPGGKTFDLEAAIAFPTDHMRRIIEAARADKTILELPIYDGSDRARRSTTRSPSSVAPSRPTSACRLMPRPARKRSPPSSAGR